MGEPSTQAANLETNAYTVDETKAIASRLGLDNIAYVLRAPVYAEKHPGSDGRLFYGNGLIKTTADLAMLQLPDPYSDELYEEAELFARKKGAFSAWFVTRIGIFPTWLSMGIECFSLALYENRRFVEDVLDTYCDWAAVVAERVCQLGFDVYVSTDDMAFKTAPFFSPRIFANWCCPVSAAWPNGSRCPGLFTVMAIYCPSSMTCSIWGSPGCTRSRKAQWTSEK